MSRATASPGESDGQLASKFQSAEKMKQHAATWSAEMNFSRLDQDIARGVDEKIMPYKAACRRLTMPELEERVVGAANFDGGVHFICTAHARTRWCRSHNHRQTTHGCCWNPTSPPGPRVEEHRKRPAENANPEGLTEEVWHLNWPRFRILRLIKQNMTATGKKRKLTKKWETSRIPLMHSTCNGLCM